MVQPRSGYPSHNYDPNYVQPYASSTSYNSRSNPQPHGYHQSQHGYAPRGPHNQYYPPQQGGGYNNSSGHAYNNNQQHSAGWAPRGNQGGGGGRGQQRPQHGGGNQFSALNRDGASRRPHRR